MSPDPPAILRVRRRINSHFCEIDQGFLISQQDDFLTEHILLVMFHAKT